MGGQHGFAPSPDREHLGCFQFFGVSSSVALRDHSYISTSASVPVSLWRIASCHEKVLEDEKVLEGSLVRVFWSIPLGFQGQSYQNLLQIL